MLMFALVGVSTTSTVLSQARLVKDINTAEYRHFNEYSQLTNAQGLFYFVSRGKELWKSDGTTSGTVRVKTLYGIQNLTLIGNTFYFAGKDENGLELWKSDGTAEGTVRVKDIRPGSTGSTPKHFTGLNETIFFVANDGRGEELWKTDGTSTGTVLVKDIRTGTSGSKPLYLTAMNNMVYFTANDGKHGRELWRSDGSAAGTAMVKDIETRSGRSSEPQELVALNGLLYFSANQSVSGREFWKSDGTANGTAQLKDINPGTASSGITAIRRMGNAIYFTANNGSSGTALWRSSGTSAGTAMLKTLVLDEETEYQETEEMRVLDNRMYWLARSISSTTMNYVFQVWVSDGTAEGTRLAATFENRETPARFTYMNNKIYYFSSSLSEDRYGPFRQLNSINPDGSGHRVIWGMWTPVSVGDEDQYHNSTEIIAFNNVLFFAGVRDDVEGYKLLKSNGSETPPVVLVDTYRRTQSSFPNTMVKNNSGVYFLTQNNAWNDQQLWHTDGTSKGTVLLKSSPGVSSAVTVNNTAYFAAWGNGLGFELWKTDGTPAGTTSLKALDHYPRLVDVAGMLFFYNDAGEVWTSDGTSAGTVLLKKFSGLEHYPVLVNVAGTLFLYNNAGEVWKTDGTSAGTVLLKKFPGIEHVAASGSIAYIVVRSASGGQELWKSNGLSAGTLKVKTIRSVEGPGTSVRSATLGNIFYFIGHDGQHGHELWRTDGTDIGTFMVKDIRTSDNEENITDIEQLMTFGNAIYINAKDAGGEMSLFISDGTNAGTNEIYDSDRIRQFIPYNDQLLFTTNRYAGWLFATDGTTAGTRMLRFLPTNYGWWISHAQVNDILYFGFYGSDVMWRTDGTECGTMEIAVGVTKVDNLVPAGDNLILFSGHHNFYGEELFAINVNALPVPSCPEVSAARQETSAAKEEGDAERVMYTPNPFDGVLTVVINSDRQSTAEIVVHDMAGQPVTSGVLETNTTYQLGSNWREGIYIMRIYVDGKVTYKRVVKGGGQ